MEEYEYSFKVKNIQPYIDYCMKNQYEKVSEVRQNRVVYENKHSKDIIARVTTKIVDGKKEITFDCKNVGREENHLKVSMESLPIKITKSNKDSIYSMLEVMDFYKATDNDRIRYVYQKDGVTFELDDYKNPIICVVGIEGKKEEVDKVYFELSNTILEYEEL